MSERRIPSFIIPPEPIFTPAYSPSAPESQSRQINRRLTDEEYLASHPELQTIVMAYFIEAMRRGLTDDASFKFAIEHFTEPDLLERAQKTLELAANIDL